jgi:NFU1 iron-sulfur cluster scaffold homolog, mitochondrial
MGFRVLEIQPTPNPNAAKFVLDRPVTQQPMSFFNSSAARDYPLARELFAIPGVSSLLMLGDFITINKSPDTAWDDITDRARSVLASAADSAV